MSYDYYDYSTSYADNSSAAAGAFAGLAAFGVVFWIICMAIAVVQIVAMWKLFKKAGRPGWASIIPVYNYIVLIQVAEAPMWYLALVFLVAPVGLLMTYIKVAEKFGKSAGFGVLIWFFPFVGLPILAFGKSQYLGMPVGQYQQPVYNQPMQQPMYNQSQMNAQPQQPMYNQPVQPQMNVQPMQQTYQQPVQPQVAPQAPVQPQAKTCPTCSAANPVDAQFCANCGNRI